jgi:dipeptidyl aminopeptidase/acylaminoacyl peptidase
MRYLNKTCASVALMAVLAALPASAQDTAEEAKPAVAAASKKFEAMDVFELEYAASPAVSPDGKWLVYVRRSNDIMTDSTRSNLWIVSSDGADHRPLLSGTHAYYSPSWSPDGKRLAYLSNEEGKTQLFVRWMDTGQTALVTNLQSSPSSITWSPDGETIAFTMSVPEKDKPLKVKMPSAPKGAKWSPAVKYVSKARYQADGRGILEPAYTHVFVVPALGGTARQISDGNYNHRGPLAFTPDGKEIIVSANRSDNWEYEARESDLYAFTLDGAVRRITSAPGAEFSPAVSPDGKLIAYLKMDDQKLAYRNDYLHVIGLDGEGDKNLSADIDNSLGSPKWDDKGKGLYYQMTVRGVDQVGYVTLSGGHRTVAMGLGGTSLGRPYSSGDYDAAGGTVAFTKGSDQRPADLYVARGGKAMPRQLTALNEDALGHKHLGKVHEIVYKSSIDGEEIQGWYLTPPGYEEGKKYPTILEIHGGPHLSYGPHFSAEMQRFAAEGYVVFYDNHRGSTSYGERFALLLQNKYSSEYDFSDHMSGLDALIEKGIADGDQLYITGGSAGGIASAYAIGLTDRFRAAAVAKPVINWISKVLTADSYLGQIPFQFPGMPWDNVEHYWKRSPLSLVGNVTTPTMLITGEADRRTPISETEQFYQALKLRKVDTIMVRVPESPHGIAGKPSRLIAKVENILAWFDKYK